jgi:hypothetical protein
MKPDRKEMKKERFDTFKIRFLAIDHWTMRLTLPIY